MSNLSPSLETVQQEKTHESDVVCEGSLSRNRETLDQPDPPLPKSDPRNIHPKALNLEDNSTDEEQDHDEDGGEIDEVQEQETPAVSLGTDLHVDPPIPAPAPHVAVRDVTLTSLSRGPNTRRGASKRKKGKGKGRPNLKKQQAMEEKIRSLMIKLNPIPFIPNKILDFAKHEGLLRKLGLWDFVHIDFDRNIRVDLIAQLIATYKTKTRASYINGHRINVSRADLARAFMLPKKAGNAGGVEVDFEQEPLSDDSIWFIIEFVSDWMLLHDDDAWMMPNKMSGWFKLIKDGHPEKVDWASVFWFMVEEELKQGGLLTDCYYASHLQHLISCQHKDLFLTVKSDSADAQEENHEVIEKSTLQEGCLLEGPSTELKLGQDDEKEEGIMDVEMMDVEKCKDIDDGDEDIEEEQGQWLLRGRNNIGEHFMQRCCTGNVEEFEGFEEKKVEEEEIEDEDGNNFNVFHNDDALQGDGFTGKLLQAMEANQMDMRVDMLPHINSTSSFFNSVGKRVIDHDDHHISHHANGSNKRLSINDTWDYKRLDFGTCMEQIQHVTETARMLYEEKDQALEHSNNNQRILLIELQKRDAEIEHLHKTRLEETQKKDDEIYRFERELYLMESVLEDYRKALKETQKTFAEYREKAQLPEEPTYKNVGPGGLMLTAVEIEKLRKKREEENKMDCLIIEQKMKEIEDDWAGRFDEYVEKCDLFESRITGLEADVEVLIELYEKRTTSQTEEAVPEVFGAQSEETVVKAEESVSIAQTAESV